MSQHAAATWDASVKKQQHRLRKRKFADVKGDLSYDGFHQSLEEMQNASKNRMINKSLLALRPAFEQLNTFEKAISSCVQAHAMPASLIWGVLQALLKVRVPSSNLPNYSPECSVPIQFWKLSTQFLHFWPTSRLNSHASTNTLTCYPQIIGCRIYLAVFLTIM